MCRASANRKAAIGAAARSAVSPLSSWQGAAVRRHARAAFRDRGPGSAAAAGPLPAQRRGSQGRDDGCRPGVALRCARKSGGSALTPQSARPRETARRIYEGGRRAKLCGLLQPLVAYLPKCSLPGAAPITRRNGGRSPSLPSNDAACRWHWAHRGLRPVGLTGQF